MSSVPELYSADVSVEPYPLRPLTTGEIVDRLFAIYRRYFSLFLGISLLPAMITLLSGSVRVLMMHRLHISQSTSPLASSALGAEALIGALVALAAYGISQAATTSAISSVYLGEETSTKQAYTVASKHWLRFAWLGVLQMLWAAWLPTLILIALITGFSLMAAFSGLPRAFVGGVAVLLVVLCIPYWVYRFARVSLAMPASVIEDARVVASVKRSKSLQKERRFRVCVLFLLIIVLYCIVGAFVGILALGAQRGAIHMTLVQVVQLAVNFFTSLLLQPIGAIGVALFYFDERVRQEAFDLEFMLQRNGHVEADTLPELTPEL